jgi:mannose-1-phosphate guanylyltransferase
MPQGYYCLEVYDFVFCARHFLIMQLIPVILCGGAGSRLWPVSRDSHPKPFIRLADGESLLQKAFLRGADLPGVREILTVTNRAISFKIEDEYGEVNKNKLETTYILEPVGRNTAPAIAIAAQYIAQKHGENAQMLVLAADHIISDHAAFIVAVGKAQELAAKGSLVTFGIEPTAPETGYGYIEASGNEVIRFVEKPSLEKATEYLASGRFLWNSGMFCFRAGAMLDAMRASCPSILAATEACLASSQTLTAKGRVTLALDEETFAGVPADSIDYAVMERASDVAVVPCSIGWSDVGSWKELGALAESDEQGNRVSGQAMLQDVRNCFVQGDQRVVCGIGLEDLIVVDTPDALLVAHKERAQDVKQFYSTLKQQGHYAHKHHLTEYRPWGSYTVLEEGECFKIKRIEVKPGGSLSLQMHHHRSEHWIVVSGMARVVNGEKEMFVATNESTYIPAGCTHRLENPGVLDLVMIEVQSGQYLGEDDIVRFQDNYGRA